MTKVFVKRMYSMNYYRKIQKSYQRLYTGLKGH